MSSVGGPFARLRWVAVVAAAYAIASVVWVASGATLPGGRWLAVHLFTLGVLTNVVLAMSDHFARALTHAGGGAPVWRGVVANLAIGVVLWAIPNGAHALLATAATLLTLVVTASYVGLRRMRTSAVAGRFGWVVRAYERAHGAFIHGAVLGALMGSGVLTGAWYGAARLAHLHVNLLGWGGLTLLATIVFFGPTVAHVRIEPAADVRAARALRLGASALAVAVLALLASGAGGALAVAARLVAGAGLGAYAWSATVVCRPVARAVSSATPAAGPWAIRAVATWFPVVAWVDALVVATGRLRLLDGVGLALFLGVLAPSIAAALGYIAPFLRPSGEPRDAMRRRLEVGAAVRVTVWNAGAVLAVAAALLGPSAGRAGAIVLRVGWTAVAAALLAQLLLVASALRGGDRTVAG